MSRLTKAQEDRLDRIESKVGDTETDEPLHIYFVNPETGEETYYCTVHPRCRVGETPGAR